MSVAFNIMKVSLDRNRRYVELFFIVFYIVGFIGTATPVLHDLFIGLFPFALLLSFVAILIYHSEAYTRRTVFVLILIGLSGYLVEVIGVKSHIIFGSYRYGNALGIKVLDTPLLIGINWLMLAYAGSSVAENFRLPLWLQIIFASAIMLIYDIILEQIAPVLGMWTWEGNSVPLQNYIAWFVVSMAFQFLIKAAGVRTRNPLAFKIILIQAIFFILLILFYRL